MRRLTVLVVVAVLLLPGRAEAKNTLHALLGRLHKERSVLRFCKAHERAVARDPHARHDCGRAWWLVPRLREDIAYLIHLSRAHRRARIVRIARQYLGVRYVWGGTTPRGFDCSGLVQYVYRRAGIHLGRTTWDQIGQGLRVARPLPGDVVFTNGGEHEGLYLGHGVVIHAPHTGDVVRFVPLGVFRAEGWAGARRYF